MSAAGPWAVPSLPLRRPDEPRAIVIGLDTTTGLQCARILWHRGVRVVGIAADPRHPACRTNSCSRVIVASTSGDGLLSALSRLATIERDAVLIPCTDESVVTLAHARSRLDAFRLALPDADVIDRLMHPQRLHELLTEHGVPTPKSVLVGDETAALELLRELTFPFIAAPARTAAPCDGPDAQGLRFHDEGEWLSAAPALLRSHGELLVQEEVDPTAGTMYSCSCYVSPAGLPIITFVTRGVRGRPATDGPRSLSEAVKDDDVRDLALKVLSSVAFVGFGHVDAWRDRRTGQDLVLHVCVGRPTAASVVAEGGGVELILTMVCDATRSPLPSGRRQSDRQVKWLFVSRDLRSSFQALRTGHLTFGGWFRSLQGPKVYADIDLSDPAPLVRKLLGVARRAGRRLVA